MKVELLRHVKGYAYFAGQVVDFEERQALRLIEAGIAIPAKQEEKRENGMQKVVKEKR